jgi:hypothetical protein
VIEAPPKRAKPQAPAELEAVPVIIVTEQPDESTALDGGWDLLLFNDSINTREYVGTYGVGLGWVAGIG